MYIIEIIGYWASIDNLTTERQRGIHIIEQEFTIRHSLISEFYDTPKSPKNSHYINPFTCATPIRQIHYTARSNT